MKEVRLIDANKMIKDIKENYVIYGYADFLNDFFRMVEEQPTVDAVPLEDYKSMEQTVHKLTSAIADIVKHGRWEYEGMIDHTWKVFTCTECGKQCIGGGKYCPNCGARMEEENDL